MANPSPVQRTTRLVRAIAAVLTTEPATRDWTAQELATATDSGASTIYAVLGRMVKAGWLSQSWGESPTGGRPVGRYWVTDVGRTALENITKETRR